MGKHSVNTFHYDAMADRHCCNTVILGMCPNLAMSMSISPMCAEEG